MAHTLFYPMGLNQSNITSTQINGNNTDYTINKNKLIFSRFQSEGIRLSPKGDWYVRVEDPSVVLVKEHPDEEYTVYDINATNPDGGETTIHFLSNTTILDLQVQSIPYDVQLQMGDTYDIDLIYKDGWTFQKSPGSINGTDTAINYTYDQELGKITVTAESNGIVNLSGHNETTGDSFGIHFTVTAAQ